MLIVPSCASRAGRTEGASELDVSLPGIFDEVLVEGLAALEVAVDAGGRARLAAYVERLLFWNRKVNLTAVTAPGEVAEVHLVD